MIFLWGIGSGDDRGDCPGLGRHKRPGPGRGHAAACPFSSGSAERGEAAGIEQLDTARAVAADQPVLFEPGEASG